MIGRIEILEYAILCGHEQALDVLRLVGPDGYLQGYDNYQDLLYILTKGQEGKPLEII